MTAVAAPGRGYQLQAGSAGALAVSVVMFPPAVGTRAAAPAGVRAAERRPGLAACHDRQSAAPGGALCRTVIHQPRPDHPGMLRADPAAG